MLGVRRPESKSQLCVALDLEQVKSALNPFPHICEYYECYEYAYVWITLVGPRDLSHTNVYTFETLSPGLLRGSTTCQD